MESLLFILFAFLSIIAAFPGRGAGCPRLSLTAEPAVGARQVPLDLAVAALNFHPPQLGDGQSSTLLNI